MPRTTKTTTSKGAKKPAPRKKPAPAKKPPAPRAHPWTPATLMAELKKRGTAQNRKVYARHGAPSAMFGVAFADIYKLQKQIKRDHDLAQALWQSGNADAQTLAALIADPQRATRAELERWARSASWFMTIDYLAAFVATTSHALPLAKKWMASKQESTRRAGYSTLSSMVRSGAHDGVPLDASLLLDVLRTIEEEIHASPNRAREAMNTTLICIGTYRDDLHQQALAAAERIGKVEVFHGEGTNCKDFIATREIAKARAHRAKKAGAGR